MKIEIYVNKTLLQASRSFLLKGAVPSINTPLQFIRNLLSSPTPRDLLNWKPHSNMTPGIFLKYIKVGKHLWKLSFTLSEAVTVPCCVLSIVTN